MKRMTLITAVLAVLLVAASFSVSAGSDSVTFSGTFSAGNPLPAGRVSSSNLGCSSLTGGTFAYDVQQFTASVSGEWAYIDLSYVRESYYGTGFDTHTMIYSGVFDPVDPLSGGCIASLDDTGSVNLTAGVTYTVVMTPHNDGEVGQYEVLFTPAITSGDLTNAPVMTNGRPDDDAIGCSTTTAGNYAYQTFQFQPPVSGDYYFADIGSEMGTGTSLVFVVYAGAFDPSNPLTNCIANSSWALVVPLDASVTYTIAIVSEYTNPLPNYSYVLTNAGSGGTCPSQLPTNAVVRSIPNGAPAYWAPNLQSGSNFNLSPGTWWTYGTSGDFTHVWIACFADPIWVPTSAVAP